jgi:hypothetical protein
MPNVTVREEESMERGKTYCQERRDIAQTLFLTAHATQRMHQRAITHAALDAVLRWGARIEQNGATAFFLGRRHLPTELPPAAAARLEGTVVVVDRDGAVITMFRCRRLPSVMRRRLRWS